MLTFVLYCALAVCLMAGVMFALQAAHAFEDARNDRLPLTDALGYRCRGRRYAFGALALFVVALVIGVILTS